MVSAHGLTDGTARDYAWAFKILLQHRGTVARGTPKMQSLISFCRPKIDIFVRLPQFVHAQRKEGSTASKTKVICSVSKASKVQGPCPLQDQEQPNVPAATKFAKQPLKLRRSLGKRRDSGVVTETASQKRKRACVDGGQDLAVDDEESEWETLPEALQAEIDEAKEEALLESARQDPNVQAFLDAGDESDSLAGDCEGQLEQEKRTAFNTAPGLTTNEDLEVWDHVCAAIWPSDVE